MKEFLGLITIILAIIGNLSYILDILKNKSKPHMFTWLIWSISTLIVFLAQYLNGAGPGSWSTGAVGIFTIIITLLAIKYGTRDISFSDKIYFTVSIIAIVLWILIKSPLYSVIILTLVDFFAFFPTIRKTIKEPNSESLSLYIFSLARHIFSLFAIISFSLITTLFPSMLIIMNILMIVVISYYRYLIK